MPTSRMLSTTQGFVLVCRVKSWLHKGSMAPKPDWKYATGCNTTLQLKRTTQLVCLTVTTLLDVPLRECKHMLCKSEYTVY